VPVEEDLARRLREAANGAREMTAERDWLIRLASATGGSTREVAHLTLVSHTQVQRVLASPEPTNTQADTGEPGTS